MIDGKTVEDGGAGRDGFIKPERLAPLYRLEMACIEEDQREIIAEINGAVELFLREGKEFEKHVVMIGCNAMPLMKRNKDM